VQRIHQIFWKIDKFIEDSGRLFESKLFEDNKNRELNYFSSEYFLNIKN